METRRSIGIMVPGRKGRRGALRTYGRYCDADTELFAFCPDDIHWGRKQIAGIGLRRRRAAEGRFDFPQAIYNRCYNPPSDLLRRLEAAVGRGRLFNRINAFHKQDVHRLLKRSDVAAYVPDTYAYRAREAAEMLKMHKLLYLKPVYGAQGRRVLRVELADNGEVLLSMHSVAPRRIYADTSEWLADMRSRIGRQPYLMQMGIRTKLYEGKHFDMRVLVQKDGDGAWRVTNLASRIAHRPYFNTAICRRVCDAATVLGELYGKEQAERVGQKAKETALKAAQAAEAGLGTLGELSVDFVLDTEGKLWIIELNGKPLKSLYEKMRGERFRKHIFERPMAYARHLADCSSRTDGVSSQGDSSQGDSSRGDSSRGDSPQGDSSQGDPSRGDSSQGGYPRVAVSPLAVAGDSGSFPE